MTVAVVAEKPSVGRDLANVLGATRRGDGTLSGNGYVVTWAIGHLVGLAEPEGIRPEWKRWRREDLPMLPERWPLTVFDATRDQFDVVRRVLNAPDVERVICATDAGREGELIFRLIYEAAKCKRPVSRLWISSLTDEAIREGFAALRPGARLDPLADAARCRSEADWLVGINGTRAMTAFNSRDGGFFLTTVGRVQTP
ncbi:MAG TPA: toprim domain-containing protein, partial [Polyangiaceae bacterium]|nr:toprim domain-containing protein [Polyangiaceae bacterium]